MKSGKLCSFVILEWIAISTLTLVVARADDWLKPQAKSPTVNDKSLAWEPSIKDQDFELKDFAKSGDTEIDKNLIPFRNRMRVFTDGKKKYLAISKSGAPGLALPDGGLFYDPAFWGNEKELTQLSIGDFEPTGADFSIKFTDAHSGPGTTTLNVVNHIMTIKCGVHSLKLQELSRLDALKIMQGAKLNTFLPPNPEFFGKIKDKEEYIFIDRDGFRRLRVFHGASGDLRQQKSASQSGYTDGSHTMDYITPDFIVNIPDPHPTTNGWPDKAKHAADAYFLTENKNKKTTHGLEIVRLPVSGQEFERVVAQQLKTRPLPSLCDLWIGTVH